MTEDSYTNKTFKLPVGHGHELWVHDWGNPKAETVFFFLHGGPGGQCKDKYKLPFDPKTHRVIFHDQRGSGQSAPAGRWHHNTTQDLAADITSIADKLGIDQFVITGSSWGSTLALYYAINNPDRVKAVVVGGVWFGSKTEDDYLLSGAWRTHFPDHWDWYTSTVPKKYADNPSAYHLETVFGDDPVAAAESARIFGDMESGLVSLNDYYIPIPAEVFDASSSIIELRYIAKQCFMTDNYILNNTDKLTMPLHIIQGRYDFICPPSDAYALHKAVPHSDLTWIMTGHTSEHETTTAYKLTYRQLTTS